jgi:methionine synthase I (cobalamin-dependent)
VYRYIDEALDHTARLAARQAAQSKQLPICPTAVADRIGPALKIISERSNKGAEGYAAEEIVARAVKAAYAAVDEGCSALELRLMTKMAAVTGAVRGVGRAASRAQTHRIALGDACYPTELWTTACGWRFGSVPHIRVDSAEISCASCKRCTGEAT